MTRHYRHRIEQRNLPSLRVIRERTDYRTLRSSHKNAVIDCGWGRLLFGQTYNDPAVLAREMLREQQDRRDIALYLSDPHVILSLYPQDLFLDPSHTYRLQFSTYLAGRSVPAGFHVRRIQRRSDTTAIN